MLFLLPGFARKKSSSASSPGAIAIADCLCLLIATGVAGWTGCSGFSAAAASSSVSKPISVEIVPASATVQAGGSLQFSALVTGTSQTAVNWSTSGGSISASGMLKVPAALAMTNLTVTATSAADTHEQASAIVSVTPPLPSLVITTTVLNPGTVGVAYTANLSATGGQTPYQWSIVSGAPPSGIHLNAGSGAVSGTPTTAGNSSFVVGLTDKNGNVARQSLSVSISLAVSLAQCTAPSYQCVRTDTSVIPVSTLPAWGGLIGANTVFYDPSFNPKYPPRYARVTDANSSAPAIAAGVEGLQYSGFAVGSGSGDDAHFNADDSLFTVTDAQNDVYVYGLNTSTMATGLVWYPAFGIGGPVWSQTNRNDLYGLGYDGNIWRWDLTNCVLGGGTCSPPAGKLIYSFTSNCNVNPSISFNVTGGIGGNDTVFSASYSQGDQDTGDQVVAYNASTNTCYFYNTRFGTIHSYTGPQTPTTAMVTCNGTKAVAGAAFGTGANSWVGLNITIGGAVYQVASVSSGSSMLLGRTCPSGTYKMSIEPGSYVGAVTTPELYSVHDIRIDPSGSWLIVEEGEYCYSSSCNVIHAWKIGTTTVSVCPWVSWGTDAGACASHYTENANGWINADTFAGNGPSLLFRTWANLGTTDSQQVVEMNSGNVSLVPGFDNHPTNKNDPLGTHGYPVLTSTYAPETPIGSIHYPYSNEVIGWKQTGGPVFRFGHTFNSSLVPAACCFVNTYAIGAASSTGNFYMFTTDGEGTLGSTTGGTSCSIPAGTCRGDVFILNLAPPPAN